MSFAIYPITIHERMNIYGGFQKTGNGLGGKQTLNAIDLKKEEKKKGLYKEIPGQLEYRFLPVSKNYSMFTLSGLL